MAWLPAGIFGAPSPLVNPTIRGQTSYQPAVPPVPPQPFPLYTSTVSGGATISGIVASYAGAPNLAMTGSDQWQAQTTSAAYSSVTIAPQSPQPALLLPGQVGAPIATGKLRVDCEVDVVDVVSTNTTAAISAGYKMSWGWNYSGAGSVTSEGSTQTQPFTSGTNAGQPPSNWGAALALNAAQTAVVVQLTTDAAGTYHTSALVQWRYLQ